MPKVRRTVLAAVAATIGALVGAVLVTPGVAAAATPHNGVCESGEFCYYYNTGNAGSLSDFSGSARNLGTGNSGGCFVFDTPGQNGAGRCVKNDAGSVWNRTAEPVYVFFNSDFGGLFHRVAPNAEVDLIDGVRNENASHIVGEASLAFPLTVTQTEIKDRSPRWCYTNNANCHHDYNAADIFAAVGKKVVSPVAGTVMTRNVRTGACPGSTVTVKDKWGRLWYFAHMRGGAGNPVPVTVGQSVSKGTVLGYVGDTVQACNTDPHLHIDMRVGVNSRVDCSGAACAGYGFVNNQPLLRRGFAGAPA